MTFLRPALAVLLLAGAPTMAAAALSTGNAGGSDLRQYVRARLSDSAGLPDAAAVSYAKLLESSPDDRLIATRAYRQALTAGNFALATTAAHQLDRLKALPPDGVLMLLAEQITARDWAASSKVADRILREQVFAFLVPVVRGWIAFGQGRDNPASTVTGIAVSRLSMAYARDHALLLKLATNDASAIPAIRQLVAARDPRSARLQLAAAAILARRGDKPGALAILQGGTPELGIARNLVEAGKPLPGAIDTPALGLSELIAQLAIDVKGDGRAPVSLQLARIATYLAPDNAGALVATADLLGTNGYNEAALAMLNRISANNPLSDAARQERASILLSLGDRERALADARKAVTAPDADAVAFVDLGGLLSDLDKPAEAAAAYQRAIEIDARNNRRNWVYLFLKAGAIDRAGDWAGAKKLLREASAIEPNQAVILNYLGYGMLDRSENLAEAQTYIERASTLDPNDSAITDSLGWLQYKRGNYPAAITALERAVAGDPGQSVMNEHLGDAYWAAGRRIEARYAWKAALVQADKPGAERLDRKIQDGPPKSALTSK